MNIERSGKPVILGGEDEIRSASAPAETGSPRRSVLDLWEPVPGQLPLPIRAAARRRKKRNES